MGEPRRADRIVACHEIRRKNLKKTICAACRRADVYLARYGGRTSIMEIDERIGSTMYLVEHECPVVRDLVGDALAGRKGGDRA